MRLVAVKGLWLTEYPISQGSLLQYGWSLLSSCFQHYLEPLCFGDQARKWLKKKTKKKEIWIALGVKHINTLVSLFSSLPSLFVLLFQLSAVRESAWKCEKSTSAVSVEEMSAYNSAGLVDHCGFDYSCAKITAPLTVQSVQAFFCLLCCVPFNRVPLFLWWVSMMIVIISYILLV